MESAPNDVLDVHKRRTTRIVQAMPLTVSGVDALGRPFQERTSTLIINCHGCRYQSKHYVLKNMWVSLEVPHPEPGREPRVSRARVIWIQRPRTVRELFQVGVELETPGNLWGIAFAPPDWFSPLETRPSEALGFATDEAIPEPASPAGAESTSASEPSPAESNLRTMPTMPMSGSGEPSVALARQMARLVNEAKHQLHAAVRESAAHAVAEETRPLLAAIHAQVQDVAERSVQAAAEIAAQQAVRGALDQAEQTGEAQLHAARERWNRELGEHAERTGADLSDRFSVIAQERAGAFQNQLETRLNLTIEKVERAASEVDVKLAEARKVIEELALKATDSAGSALHEIGHQLQAKTEQARGQLTDLDQAIQQLHDRVASTSEAAHSDWQARINTDLAAATGQWNHLVETSLESAARQAAERFAHHSSEASLQAENEVTARFVALGTTFSEERALAESNLESVRAALSEETARAQSALAQMQSAARGMAEWSARAEGLASTAERELERRAADLVEAQSRELTDRAERNISVWTDRLQPSLEAAGQQIIVRLGAELDQQLNSRLDRATHVLADLERGAIEAETSLRSHQEALAKVSEREIESALGHLQKSIAQLEHNFGESGRAATSKWLADLDEKATEATHNTFESLFKTSEWYEKKVQNQMQSTLEKGIESADTGLREKAGELSGLFATELDHYSRSYVEHTHGQIDEIGRDALERVDKQAAEMAATSAASLAQQARIRSEEALADFQNKSADALHQVSTQMDAHAFLIHAELQAENRQASTEFSMALRQETQAALDGAKRELASQVASAADTVRVTGETVDKELRQTMIAVSDDALSEYRKRLENASNSWLVTTVSKLNQQSEQQIEHVARATEERLRETCNQVFTDLGETLRLRMLALFGANESGKAASQSD